MSGKMKATKAAPTLSQNGRKRAVLYARVSTTGQLDNTSPEGQLVRCRKYALAQHYEIVTERIEAISGIFVLARSIYNELLDMAADSQIDVIVVDIPDRLGRGDAIAKCELLAQMNGAKVEYASPGRDTSTVEGFVQKSAEQMVSGIERINIRRRMMEGKQDWARNGNVIATSFRVYGYDYERKYDSLGRRVACGLVPIENQVKTVARIFEWYVYDGKSTYAVARQLTDDGVPTPRGSKEWTPATVKTILQNETYCGVWHYRKHDVMYQDTADGVKQKMTWRDKSEWIAVSVPAIITREL